MVEKCNADQKIVLVRNDDFSEVDKYLESSKWIIESTAACSAVGCGEFKIPNTYAYVVLTRN